MFNTETKESPFQPGNPVLPEYFQGRKETIKKINRNIPKVKKGEPRHYFITGKRGIGKTSLARYVQKINEDSLISVYVPNKTNDTLEELVTNIFEHILEKLPKNSLSNKVKNIFGNIESIQIKDIGINFKPNPELKKDLVKYFPKYLKELIDSFDEDK